MRCAPITLLLFFAAGTIAYSAAATRIHHNEARTARTAFRMNQSDTAAFVLINPKQVQRAELTLGHFLTKLTGPIARSILSRSPFDELPGMIGKICKVVREKIMQFAQACGLVRSIRSYEQTSWNFTSNDWFTESLVQGSRLLSDLVRLEEEIWFNVDRYFDTHNVNLHESNKLSTRGMVGGFRFLGVINDVAGFSERLFRCLRSMSREKRKPSSFDLNQALVNLAAGSPAGAVQSFKFRLDRAFSRSTTSNGTSSERLYVVLCHLLIQRGSHYDDCIGNLRRLVACASSQDSDIAAAHDAFPVEPWVAAIANLSDCKANADGSVRCNFKRPPPRTAPRQVRYIYESILDHRIPERSALHRVADEVGAALASSGWGSRFANEACQYLAIYDEGRRRLRALSKIAARDRAAAAARKISKSLDLYKTGALKRTMLAIGNLHRSALEIERFFVHGVKSLTKESWQNHIKIFDRLFEWMTHLSQLFGCTELDDTDVDVPTTDASLVTIPPDAIRSDTFFDRNNKREALVTYRRKNQMRRQADAALDRLLRSMEHVNGIQNRSNGSTIGCLANNLLLIAAFMETIGFVSTLFCLGEQKSESSLEDGKEDSLSFVRKRRASFLTKPDFIDAEIDEIKEDSSIIVFDVIDIYNEETINSTLNAPVNVTSNIYDLIDTTTAKSVKGYL